MIIWEIYHNNINLNCYFEFCQHSLFTIIGRDGKKSQVRSKTGPAWYIPKGFDLVLPHEGLDKNLGKKVWVKFKPSIFLKKINL